MRTSVKVTALGHGVFRIEHGDGSHSIAYGVAAGTKTWVFVDGQTYLIDSAPTRRRGVSQDASALSAPMPATVTQVHVAPGQPVKTGDVLITLEAMKMELPIRATSDATVTAVHCRAGEMVQPGVPLVDLREA
jgi:biotin carboxyl carrier protein